MGIKNKGSRKLCSARMLQGRSNPLRIQDQKNKIGIKNITTQNAAEGMTTAKTIHTEAGVSALTALTGAPTPLIVAVEDAAHPPRCCACRCGGCSASPPRCCGCRCRRSYCCVVSLSFSVIFSFFLLFLLLLLFLLQFPLPLPMLLVFLLLPLLLLLFLFLLLLLL